MFLGASSVFRGLLDELERRQKAGTQKPCFMTELLDSESKDKNFTRDEIAFIAVTLLEAGSDTTRNSLLETVAGTAMYPDWIERARAELDEVCGKNAERLPTFDDIDRLPMIRASVKETVRWRYVFNPSHLNFAQKRGRFCFGSTISNLSLLHVGQQTRRRVFPMR